MLTREEALKIYENEMKYFHSTRNIQWKINISTWTFLILAIYFVTKEKPKIDDFLVIPFAIIFILLYSYFIYRNQMSLEGNKDVWNAILDALNNTNGSFLNEHINPKEISKKSKVSPNMFFWISFYIAVTLFLWILLIYFIININHPNS